MGALLHKRLRDRSQGVIRTIKVRLKRTIGQFSSGPTTLDCSQIATATEEYETPLSPNSVMNDHDNEATTRNNMDDIITETSLMVDTEGIDDVVVTSSDAQPGDDAELDSVANTQTTKDESNTPDNLQSEDNLDELSRRSHNARLTPIWTNALVEWKKEHPEAYQALEEAGIGAIKNHEQMQGILKKITGDEESTRRLRARWKEHQSSIASLRGISIGLSNLDPHKIAPLVCVSVFFTIDIILNNMNENDKAKISDILLSCDEIITEYISFERFFVQKDHHEVKEYIPLLESAMKTQYKQALQLIAQIRRWCSAVKDADHSRTKQMADGLKSRGRRLYMELGGKVIVWENEIKNIKRIHSEWLLNKKVLELQLTSIKEAKEVRDWIKKDDDPEPDLSEISANVMPDGYYQNAASWFFKNEQYLRWRAGFLNHTNTVTHASRILWLSGTPGTGKTTIMYHAFSALERSSLCNTENGMIRIIPYFCYAKATSQRPNYETILRALLWHLSISDNGRLAPKFREEYNSAMNRKNKLTHISLWERMFLTLLDSYVQGERLVFVIDALDECTDSGETDKFLRFMANKVMTRSNVHLLYASQLHIPVDKYFRAGNLSNITITRTVTRDDMEKFVNGEMARRKQVIRGSVFQEKDLLETLKARLLAHSKGMFRWVQIWLDICLPINWAHIIDNRKRAEDLLAKLEKDGISDADQYELLKKGYQHLWDFNRSVHRDERDSRIHLFHILLAALEPLTISNIKHALCMKKDGFDPRDIMTTEKLVQLGSSFLVEHYILDGPRKGQSRLRWVHASARAFISEMTVTECTGSDSIKGGDEPNFTNQKNHHFLADMFVNVVGNLHHDYWTYVWRLNKMLECEPCQLDQWIHYKNPASIHARSRQSLLKFIECWIPSTLLSYLIRDGLTHCRLAASKSSLFDPMWERVLREIVLSEKSALGLTLLQEPRHTIEEASTLNSNPENSSTEPRYIKALRASIRLPNFFMSPSLFSDYDPLMFLHKNEAGDLKLLFSHVLACLNIVHEDDLMRSPAWTEVPEIRRILQDAECVGEGRKASQVAKMRETLTTSPCTALAMAIRTGNRAAVEMIGKSRELYGKKIDCTVGKTANVQNDMRCSSVAMDLEDEKMAKQCWVRV